MGSVNQTTISEFILLGLSEDPALQPFIFTLFLSIYLITTLGNLLIILAVTSDSQLHTPMYFFLSSLSLNDICLITTTIPKMLVNIQTLDQTITYTGCLSQVCLILNFAGIENCLLAVMAYDRYVAICHPLKYIVIMNPHFCVISLLFSLLCSIIHALFHTLMVLLLSFCTEVEIPHFFCELAQIIKLACSDNYINFLLVYTVSVLFFGIPVFGILLSYIQIVSSVLKMSSLGGKYKAFSTCGSHLSVVLLFYGTGFGVHISSAFTDSPRKTIVASVMYTVVTQMLNTFIYSLRNKEMKKAFRKIFSRITYIL
ncbi:putative gustatory receptor clone PTE38 [Cricetulus griseus]|uniref:Olfactory receptor n=1 Tax=Cricetulus griseus TaxID=10029 RepID=A0A9J7JMY9_CRIGR|nr:putative gustatory receptor clone PTE38 [Cricetulus griseus]XP_027267445.1 putative gustatory receptor clone PTE38 [Cricetulus griseus]